MKIQITEATFDKRVSELMKKHPQRILAIVSYDSKNEKIHFSQYLLTIQGEKKEIPRSPDVKNWIAQYYMLFSDSIYLAVLDHNESYIGFVTAYDILNNSEMTLM